jgi:hypothetical protein
MPALARLDSPTLPLHHEAGTMPCEQAMLEQDATQLADDRDCAQRRLRLRRGELLRPRTPGAANVDLAGVEIDRLPFEREQFAEPEPAVQRERPGRPVVVYHGRQIRGGFGGRQDARVHPRR